MDRRLLRARAASRQRTAATLVEMAFVLPIIFLFFSAMIEISRVLLLQHSVDTAAYEGVRSAMVPGAQAQDAVDAALTLLSAAKLKSATVSVTPAVLEESTATISVRVELPVSQNSWIAPFWFKGNVASEVTLFCERPPMIQLTGVPQMKAKSTKLKGTTSSL